MTSFFTKIAPAFLAITASTTTLGVAAVAIPAPAMAAELSDSGNFRGAGSYDTAGKAEIIKLKGGGFGLKLHGNFSTDSAPDLRIWLSEASNPRSKGAVRGAKHVDLGALKSSRGEQIYRIPAGVNLSEVRSAVIWCRAFGVFFGAASLA